MRIRSYPDFQATRSAALGVMADVGALEHFHNESP
jgi:hypothetical protein